MATPVNYTCKSFMKLNPGLLRYYDLFFNVVFKTRPAVFMFFLLLVKPNSREEHDNFYLVIKYVL